MTGTEVAVRRPQQAAAMTAKIQYARALAESGLLPRHYQRDPANVLWAVEYGDMLGLSPMAAMTGVHVIEGKPSASAGLISALVRRAGHKLRVRGDGKTATCQIVRADDPDYTFEVTWTLKKNADGNPSAEEAKLLGKDVWQKYPASMLKSRAITQCARDACEEALFGLHYTAEELGAEVDEDGVPQGVDAPQGAGATFDGAEPVEVHNGPRDADEADLADEARTIRAATQQAQSEDPWYVRPEPSADQEWLAATKRIIPQIGLEACRKLWPEVHAKFRAGEISEPDATEVLGVLKARMESLANPQADPPCDAEIVDDTPALADDDPWHDPVMGAGDITEAETLLADAESQLREGTIDVARYEQLEAAIKARFPDAGTFTGPDETRAA